MSSIPPTSQNIASSDISAQTQPPIKGPLLDNGIRIKTIVHTAFIALSTTFLLSGAVSVMLAASGIAVSLMTTTACVSAVAVAVLLAGKAWQIITPLLPDRVRVIANYIQSIVTGVFSIITLGLIFPINLEKADPKTPQECTPKQRSILLIHGFCGSSNNWLYHLQRLRSAGFTNIFTINLGSIFHSIDDYAMNVLPKIDEIVRLTGCHEIDIVGHSMGGLVGRHYRYAYADSQRVNVRKIITIGTPLNGTFLAYVASWISAAARQMEPGSDYVRRQQQMASEDDATEYFHIGTKVDSIVLPVSSALDGKGRRMRTETLDATGHIEYLFSDATADLLIRELQEPAEEALV